MHIDLIEKSPLEKLATDVGGKYFDVLASCGRPGGLHRFGNIAAEEGDIPSGLGVVGVMGEDEDRTIPLSAIDGGSIRERINGDPLEEINLRYQPTYT